MHQGVSQHSDNLPHIYPYQPEEKCREKGPNMSDTYKTRKWLLSRREQVTYNHQLMFRRLKELYRQYKPYIRVDLIMYAVLILLIILYFVVSIIID
jgi:hypothetical protein